MRQFVIIALSLGLGLASSSFAMALDSSTQCSAGNANIISETDVTGNLGGATDCWGTFNGNDDTNTGFTVDGVQFDFVSKWEGTVVGEDIGLEASGLVSGTWEYDPNLFQADQFLLVIKAASRPGFGVWFFGGSDAASFQGTFDIAWNRALSHISIYAAPSQAVPAPATLALMFAGFMGAGFVRRRHR